jgi:hypothetical protein
MRTAMIFLLVSAFSVCVGAQESSSNRIDLAYLKTRYFDSIEITATNISVTFKASGQRFFFSINGGALVKGSYGQVVTANLGEKLMIVGRDDQLIFSPLPTPIRHHGLDVQEHSDRRSFGGGTNISHRFMVRSPESERRRQAVVDGEDMRFVEPSIQTVEKLYLDAR